MANEYRLVILESPYRGASVVELRRNIEYAKRAMRDSILRGESPFASHLLLAAHDILADADPYERALGISLGLAWGKAAVATVAYIDYGISSGMQRGIDAAQDDGRPIVFRRIGE